MFIVVNLRTNVPWPDREGNPVVFATGTEAAAAAAQLNSAIGRMSWYTPNFHRGATVGARGLLSPYLGGDDMVCMSDKWQSRPLKNDENWRERETARFENAKYERVPWDTDLTWIEAMSKDGPHKEHFVHVSSGDDGMIAYTPNDGFGRLDRKLRTTPSRYIFKFFGENATSKKWLNMWTKKKSDIDLKFATTREEIRRVYVNGPNSCMKGEASRFWRRKGAPHPVEAYAGALQVAYVENSAGKITARCVCSHEKQTYGRLYGHQSAILKSLLDGEGFKAGGFDGIKMPMIDVTSFTKVPNSYLMPYMDSPTQFVRYDEKTNELILVDNTNTETRTNMKIVIPASTTSGHIVIPKPYVSELSGKTFDPRKDPAITVRVGYRKQEVWSQSEFNVHGYNDPSAGERLSQKAFPPITALNGCNIIMINPKGSRKGLPRIATCPRMGYKFLMNGNHRVCVGLDAEGKKVFEDWCQPALDRDAFHYRRDDTFYARWMMSDIHFLRNIPVTSEHDYASTIVNAAGHIVMENLKRFRKEINERNAHLVKTKSRMSGRMWEIFDLQEEEKEREAITS